MLGEFQSPSQETIITKESPTIDNLEEYITIASTEGKKSISILNNVYGKEMTIK